MADPILPDIWKAQVVFRGPSGLPEDVFINNLYFRNDGVTVGPAEVTGAMKRVLDAFYTGTAANGTSIGSMIAGGIVAVPWYRFYDLGEAPPRTRHQVDGAALPSARSTPLPFEVAVALSFFAGENAPRNRGRIYLGPLSSSALVGTNNFPQPVSNLTAAIADRASNMGRTTENVTWVMVTKGGTKPPLDPPNAKVITAGWVDNAWDTVRRRGLAATGRTVFSAT